MILIFVTNYFANSVSYFSLYGILTMLALLLFLRGLSRSDDKVYKENIIYYFIIYLVALIFTIFLINRSVMIDFRNIFNQIQLIPFSLLFNTIINKDLGLHQLIFNYVGNFLLLTPFSLLLVLYKKKYTSYQEMFKIVFIFTFIIETLELILGVGAFDVDDFILNISGTMFFLYLYNRIFYKIFDKIFFTNMNLNRILVTFLCITLFLITCFLNLKMIVKIINLYDLERSNDYVRGLYADRKKEFEIDGYSIYIDDLLVVLKINNDSVEVDENIKDVISITDIFQRVERIKDEEEYEQYLGKDVNVYNCKKRKKIIFSAKPFQNEYCSIEN